MDDGEDRIIYAFSSFHNGVSFSGLPLVRLYLSIAGSILTLYLQVIQND